MDQPSRIGKRERADQHMIGKSESRRRCTDAQRRHNHDRKSKPRRARQHAHGVSQILLQNIPLPLKNSHDVL
jgi:hypothetical protein